jgi:hypothetical protein
VRKHGGGPRPRAGGTPRLPGDASLEPNSPTAAPGVSAPGAGAPDLSSAGSTRRGARNCRGPNRVGPRALRAGGVRNDAEAGGCVGSRSIALQSMAGKIVLPGPCTRLVVSARAGNGRWRARGESIGPLVRRWQAGPVVYIPPAAWPEADDTIQLIRAWVKPRGFPETECKMDDRPCTGMLAAFGHQADARPYAHGRHRTGGERGSGNGLVPSAGRTGAGYSVPV